MLFRRLVKLLDTKTNYSKFFQIKRKLGSLPVRDRSKLNIIPENDIKKYESYSDLLFEEITKTKLVTEEPTTRQYLGNVFKYNFHGGSRVIPFCMILTYNEITKKENLRNEMEKNLYILAWCYEIMNVVCYLIEDLADPYSQTRRGRPCWHYVKNIGTNAANDAEAFYFLGFKFLQKYMGNHKNYQKLLETWLDSSYRFSISSVQSSFKWGDSVDTYFDMTKHKVGMFTFYNPLLMVLQLLDQENEQLTKTAYSFFLYLSRIYQMQNDYNDAFGEKYSGRIGTNISNGVNSWPIITAYKMSSPSQMQILQQCYGKNDPVAIEKVKNVYKQVGIPQLLIEEEKLAREILEQKLNELDNDFHRNLLKKYLNALLPVNDVNVKIA